MNSIFRKGLFFGIIIMISNTIFAQHNVQTNSHLNTKEAIEMIQLYNSFTFIDLYQSDKKILPKGYIKEYTSGVFGMDNKYQLYTKGENTVVINMRGSTDKKESWMENFYSSMIPAKGTMTVEGEKFDYNFSNANNAAVHAGYALGIGFLKKDLLFHLKMLIRAGYNNLIISGHSQGGAIANLLAAYISSLPKEEFTQPKTMKVYAFAAPMVGNIEFIKDYDKRFCSTNKSFNLTNPKDPIPRFPLSYNDTTFRAETLNSLISGNFNGQQAIIDGAIHLFGNQVKQGAGLLGYLTSNQIKDDVGHFTLPAYSNDINYMKIGNQITIRPADYPKRLKDPSILQNDSLMAIYTRDENGVFTNDKLYEKEPMFFQHKPYNYYISMLRMYDPKRYESETVKILPENL